MPRDDQPFKTANYNTDQFLNPTFGFTVHDDGTDFYTDPFTGIIWGKNRFLNGWCGYTPSYRIELIRPQPPLVCAVNAIEAADTMVANANVQWPWGFEASGVNDGLHRPRPVFGALKHKIQFGRALQ